VEVDRAESDYKLGLGMDPYPNQPTTTAHGCCLATDGTWWLICKTGMARCHGTCTATTPYTCHTDFGDTFACRGSRWIVLFFSVRSLLLAYDSRTRYCQHSISFDNRTWLDCLARYTTSFANTQL
jgi:hypothetical protein